LDSRQLADEFVQNLGPRSTETEAPLPLWKLLEL